MKIAHQPPGGQARNSAKKAHKKRDYALTASNGVVLAQSSEKPAGFVPPSKNANKI
jgi:hypothetical protein